MIIFQKRLGLCSSLSLQVIYAKKDTNIATELQAFHLQFMST